MFVITFVFFAVYNAISDGYPKNSVLRAVVSFIPSLILTSFIVPFKNRIQKKVIKKAEEKGIFPQEKDQPSQDQYGATVEMKEPLVNTRL